MQQDALITNISFNSKCNGSLLNIAKVIITPTLLKAVLGINLTLHFIGACLSSHVRNKGLRLKTASPQSHNYVIHLASANGNY